MLASDNLLDPSLTKWSSNATKHQLCRKILRSPCCDKKNKYLIEVGPGTVCIDIINIQCCRICWCGWPPDILTISMTVSPDCRTACPTGCPTVWLTAWLSDKPTAPFPSHWPVVNAELRDVGHLEIQKLLKTDEKIILAVNTCVAQSFGTVWIGRERPWSFFIPFHVCIPMEQNITKYHKKKLDCIYFPLVCQLAALASLPSTLGCHTCKSSRAPPVSDLHAPDLLLWSRNGQWSAWCMNKQNKVSHDHSTMVHSHNTATDNP